MLVTEIARRRDETERDGTRRERGDVGEGMGSAVQLGNPGRRIEFKKVEARVSESVRQAAAGRQRR